MHQNNEKMMKRLYAIMNDNRKDFTMPFSPGIRLKHGMVPITDCYHSQDALVGRAQELRNRAKEHVKQSQAKQIMDYNLKVHKSIVSAKSAYTQETLAKEYKVKKNILNSMRRTTPLTAMHLFNLQKNSEKYKTDALNYFPFHRRKGNANGSVLRPKSASNYNSVSTKTRSRVHATLTDARGKRNGHGNDLEDFLADDDDDHKDRAGAPYYFDGNLNDNFLSYVPYRALDTDSIMKPAAVPSTGGPYQQGLKPRPKSAQARISQRSSTTEKPLQSPSSQPWARPTEEREEVPTASRPMSGDYANGRSQSFRNRHVTAVEPSQIAVMSPGKTPQAPPPRRRDVTSADMMRPRMDPSTSSRPGPREEGQRAPDTRGVARAGVGRSREEEQDALAALEREQYRKRLQNKYPLRRYEFFNLQVAALVLQRDLSGADGAVEKTTLSPARGRSVMCDVRIADVGIICPLMILRPVRSDGSRPNSRAGDEPVATSAGVQIEVTLQDPSVLEQRQSSEAGLEASPQANAGRPLGGVSSRPSRVQQRLFLSMKRLCRVAEVENDLNLLEVMESIPNREKSAGLYDCLVDALAEDALLSLGLLLSKRLRVTYDPSTRTLEVVVVAAWDENGAVVATIASSNPALSSVL